MENTFAGTLTYETQIDTSKLQEKHLVIRSEESENITLFVFGKTKIKDSDELIKHYGELGELVAQDISISTEDNMFLLNNEFEKDGLYEVASFEGAQTDIRDVVDRFEEAFEVICVRESEESEKFGNRIVKVDFVY